MLLGQQAVQVELGLDKESIEEQSSFTQKSFISGANNFNTIQGT